MSAQPTEEAVMELALGLERALHELTSAVRSALQALYVQQDGAE